MESTADYQQILCGPKTLEIRQGHQGLTEAYHCMHSFLKPSVYEETGEITTLVVSNVEKSESKQNSRIQKVRSGSSHSSLFLERKKLALPNEKKRQEL